MKAKIVNIKHTRYDVEFFYNKPGLPYPYMTRSEKSEFKKIFKELYPDSYEYCMTYMLKDGEKTGKRYFTPEVLEDLAEYKEIMQGILDHILK